MTWSEHSIARAISLQTLAKKCVVLVDNCNWTGYECDVLGVTNDLRIIDVEVKISRADLKADAKKDKWWHRQFAGYAPEKEVYNDAGRLIRIERQRMDNSTARVWPVKVWKHYYAVPAEVWNDMLFEALPSPASGVLVLREGKPPHPQVIVECVRRSTPNKDAGRLTAEQVMDISRLANLRMWEAYRRRDEAVKAAAQAREAVAA